MTETITTSCEQCPASVCQCEPLDEVEERLYAQQSIIERGGGDAAKEGEAVAYHVRQINVARRARDARKAAIAEERRELERRLEQLARQEGFVDQEFADEIRHDAGVLAHYIRESDLFSGRKKSRQLGSAELGRTDRRDQYKIDIVDRDALARIAALADCVETVRKIDLNEAKKRLEVTGNEVVVAETGVCLGPEVATVRHIPAHSEEWIKIDGERIRIDTYQTEEAEDNE